MKRTHLITALLVLPLLYACGDESRGQSTNAPASEVSQPRYDPDLLQSAALHNLSGKLILLNSYDARTSGTQTELREARESVANVRAWAQTLTDAAYRDAVLDWTDYAERKADEYERAMLKGPDDSEERRRIARAEKERAVNSLARTLPKPPNQLEEATAIECDGDPGDCAAAIAAYLLLFEPEVASETPQ